jgi:hypothetical protein
VRVWGGRCYGVDFLPDFGGKVEESERFRVILSLRIHFVLYRWKIEGKCGS